MAYLKPIQKEAVWNGVLQQDSMWCYAREKSYKKQLREMHKSHSRFVGQAKKLKKYIAENFTEQTMYSKFVNAMQNNTSTKEESLVMVV